MPPLLFWIVVVLVLLLAAGLWFDYARRREGRSPYVDRRGTKPMVDVPVAGEMVERPPERRVDHTEERDLPEPNDRPSDAER